MLSTDTLSFLIISISLLSFIYILPNFIMWMLIAEILWIGIYTSFLQYSSLYDAICLLIGGLLILCLATSESAIGLSLVLFNFTVTGNIHGATLNNTWTWNTTTQTLFSKL